MLTLQSSKSRIVYLAYIYSVIWLVVVLLGNMNGDKGKWNVLKCEKKDKFDDILYLGNSKKM